VTVKELIEVLEALNPDATVYLANDSGESVLNDRDIFNSRDGESVTIDTSVDSLAYKGEK
jgi:hypothetical protein